MDRNKINMSNSETSLGQSIQLLKLSFNIKIKTKMSF